jgi:DNA-binding IclR family transcriptional regulator
LLIAVYKEVVGQLQTKRKMTDRQVAVLAAVERLGEPTLPELAGQFPDLAPSTVLRVVEALLMRKLVEWRGELRWVHAGDAVGDGIGMNSEEQVVRFRAAPLDS